MNSYILDGNGKTLSCNIDGEMKILMIKYKKKVDRTRQTLPER